jgi:hypothetical protein
VDGTRDNWSKRENLNLFCALGPITLSGRPARVRKILLSSEVFHSVVGPRRPEISNNTSGLSGRRTGCFFSRHETAKSVAVVDAVH